MSQLLEMESLKKTPLYDRHVALGGKIVNFGGYALPVYYSNILTEHQWTRKSASAFDVSHLGEIQIEGEGAFEFLQRRLTNDLTPLKDRQVLYNLLCQEDGGVIDDLLVYRDNAKSFYLIVNAANIEADYEAFLKNAPKNVEIHNRSEQTACIAIQGPKSEEALEKLFGFNLKSLAYYTFKEERFSNSPVWISRSGYTGEDGFEIFSSNELCLMIWDKLTGEGKKEGVMPAGLGARNTLRLEAGNGLYGNDVDKTTTPLEAGLSWAVSFTKGDFTGREALLRQKEQGLRKRLVGFKMLDRPIAREHYRILSDSRSIGTVTSGSFAPSIGYNIGLGYVEKGFEVPGTRVDIEIHGRPVPAEIVRRPFIQLKHKKGLSHG